MNILVTGANGQLGSEIRDLVSNYKEFKFFFGDLPTLDICNADTLDRFILSQKISVVINCAAYTAVDEAEQEAEIAEQINSEGVYNLVKALEKVDGKLIQISTDYVFDGNHCLPYQESDKVDPIGVYGNTKRRGELAVLGSDIDGIVIRTSWLYSAYGNNFVKTMLKLGRERDKLGVIFDQLGTPTYANDLAKICLDILSDESSANISAKGKIYHYSNEGVASWYDFATAVMELGGLDCKVRAIQTKDYPTPSKRPNFSVLNKSKIKRDLNIRIPYWRDSLKKCIQILNSH